MGPTTSVGVLCFAGGLGFEPIFNGSESLEYPISPAVGFTSPIFPPQPPKANI